jgi:hypothetical protein
VTDLTRTTFTYLPQDAPVAFHLYAKVCDQLYDVLAEREELLAERDRTHALIRRVVALDDLAQHHAPRAKAKRRAAIQALAERVDPT